MKKNKVYSVLLSQDYNGAVWAKNSFDVAAPNAVAAIRKAIECAKAEGDFFKTKPIDVDTVRLVTDNLR